jgi:hypothetical protein
MTEVEITPQADDHLEELETEARERILEVSLRSGPSTASSRYRITRTTNSEPATTGRL